MISHRLRLLLCSLLAGFLLSCGYSSEPLYRYDSRTTSVAVPVFENRTNWRDLELEVTDNVIEKVTSRTPYRLADYDSADLVIRGEITGFSKPVLSEDELDSVIRSSVEYQVNVEIRDRSTNEVLQQSSGRFTASFADARGKGQVAARREAQDKVGAWVVRLLERGSW